MINKRKSMEAINEDRQLQQRQQQLENAAAEEGGNVDEDSTGSGEGGEGRGMGRQYQPFMHVPSEEDKPLEI